MTICCPCDELIHPPKPDIAAGLSTLPRHLIGFPVYRLAMLRDIPTLPPLADWRAREGDETPPEGRHHPPSRSGGQAGLGFVWH